MGFEYFYGFMGGETDQWTPYLFRDHTQIFPWLENPGYNLTTGMADDAIKHIKALNAAAPDQPFFVYYVPVARTRRTTQRQDGSTSSRASSTWAGTRMREQIFANQKRLGVDSSEYRTDPVAGWATRIRRCKACEMGHALC